jgi:hypothetical protein
VRTASCIMRKRWREGDACTDTFCKAPIPLCIASLLLGAPWHFLPALLCSQVIGPQKYVVCNNFHLHISQPSTPVVRAWPHSIWAHLQKNCNRFPPFLSLNIFLKMLSNPNERPCLKLLYLCSYIGGLIWHGPASSCYYVCVLILMPPSSASFAITATAIGTRVRHRLSANVKRITLVA